MNRQRISTLACAAAAALLAGCIYVPANTTTVRGSGIVKTQPRPVSGFSKVELNGAGRLYIDRTGTESLTISADDNLFDYITSDVRGDTLVIGPKANVNFQLLNDLTYRVTARNMNGVTVNGAALAEVKGLDSEDFAAEVNGAARLSSSGKALSQKIAINGAGVYDGSELDSKKATVTNAGLGMATVRASDELNATIDGAGVIEYIGNPKITRSIAGMGVVRPK